MARSDRREREALDSGELRSASPGAPRACLWPFKVRQLDRGRTKELLVEKLGSGLAFDSVRLIHATLRAMLNAAVDDGVILANPAVGLGKTLRLVQSKETRQEKIKAFDRVQLSRLLAAVVSTVPRLCPILLTMARTGLRVGEALALQWGDLDFEAREIRVERAISNTAVIDTPKSGHGRTVDMSAAVKDVLRCHHAKLAEAWLALPPEMDENGWPKPKGEMPPWVFPSNAWTPMDHSNVGKAFGRCLKAAGLPGHFSPHSLRHSYASLLLADGVSPAYVQEQLGHSSIELTVGTYGRWLRKRAPGAVDRLDEIPAEERVSTVGGAEMPSRETPPKAHGSNLVAASRSHGLRRRQVVEEHGDPRRTRTFNPEIKSLLLYH
jgi:integrase